MLSTIVNFSLSICDYLVMGVYFFYGPVWPDCKIIFQYLAFYNSELLPNTYHKNCQNRFKWVPNTNRSWKYSHSGEISPNLFALVRTWLSFLELRCWELLEPSDQEKKEAGTISGTHPIFTFFLQKNFLESQLSAVWPYGNNTIQSLAIYNNDNLPCSIKMPKLVQKFAKY